MENWSEQCSNLNESTFTKFISHSEGSSIGKSLLVIHKILRLFANTLTVNDKHYVFNSDNLTQPIQIQLSQKERVFMNFLRHFSNLY